MGGCPRNILSKNSQEDQPNSVQVNPKIIVRKNIQISVIKGKIFSHFVEF